jgi:ribokinase
LPRKPRICVVGSLNLDLVARCERLPRPGETVTDAVFERFPGGKGANQAVAAARLGASVTLVGAVGRDSHADEALRELRAAGVELALARSSQPTGVALILVDERGENEIVVAPGANRDVDVDGADLGARPVPREVLERCDLIVANSYEVETLGSSPLGPLFAVTLGAEGALLLEGGEEVARALPPAVTAVDGTAAGDAFTACLVVSLLEERPREEALRRACAAGALAASRPGAQPSLPTAAEVDAILAA